MRRWWSALGTTERITAVGVLVTAIIGIVAAVPAYVAIIGYGSSPQASQSAGTVPALGPTPSASSGALTPSIAGSTATASPTLAPATTGPAPPPEPQPNPEPPPVTFAITSATTVPNCSDVTGTGERPAAGRTAVIFVRVEGHLDYFYEQPVRFAPDGRSWRANRVVIGDATSTGQRFELHLYLVSDTYAEELAGHDGTPYSVPSVPGDRLTSATVTRDGNLGNC